VVGFLYFMPNITSTKQSMRLSEELLKRGIKTELEHWDGHKHVDIFLPDVPLNIEINGLQHYINPKQIIADFNRVHYSDESKCATLSITNQLVETHISEIADAIQEVTISLRLGK
jgi:very-short-patch-repair endonuclease